MDLIKEKLKTLPDSPGCYMMLNVKNEIIYVGKAKNLKNRVRSYFTGSHNLKTTKLVSEIVDFNYVQTNTERESLILELHLIKENLPKYNIKLIDDATYPFITITNEKDPRLIVERESTRDLGKRFGPYPNVYKARDTVKLLNKIYPLRKCDKLPKKACLYYHLNQCLAPCIKKEPIDYKPIIQEITAFLKGDTKKVVDDLKNEMYKASDELQFERALEYKEMIDAIEFTTEKQLISLNDFQDRDFIAFHGDHEDVSVQILKMRAGKIIDVKSDIFSYVGQIQDAVNEYILQLYEDKSKWPDELLFSDLFALEDLEWMFGKKASIPKIGDKKKLIEMAFKNAKYDFENYRYLNRLETEKTKEAEDAFKTLLGLSAIEHIEIFDNAHLFGDSSVSAMVVFKNGKPSKTDYRKYHIKQAAKMDDYGAIREVIYRRYQKALMENTKLPDLIIIDGGKGQVSAAQSVLNDLGLTIDMIGLKKNDRHQLEAVVYQNNVYNLDKSSYLYTYLGKISNEVHRFAISFHKQTRAKALIRSQLDGIIGIGEKRKTKLLETFVTIDAMKQGDLETYQRIGINETLRERIISHLIQLEKKDVQ
ncbi:excinuclease ABC subunit UvrC [Acholeplasma vituli]|uniref:UvrABC system protein C n=1 Tax=Paracholeplasma vituli TaxID=69473 RepID=A0ABT2PUA4_9MOLU|nr:excinuclease ABC subunit UvrC [Paracholeplasma vituli]MCU0104535.1 excinuclease ABC subunit UvrC [Paracholeplasma vituli]